MSETAPIETQTNTRPRAQAVLWVLIALCCLIEAALQLTDRGMLGLPRLRMLLYENGGFWPGLLRDWQANYPAQPYAMFLTHSVLHVGFVHLAVNMVTLWSLGREVIIRVGALGFCVVYTASILGGAAGFAILSNSVTPMVGASGALFGLAGALLAWGYVDRFTFRETLWPVVRAIAALALLNLVMWWAMKGQLAWETHLGGFVIGWIVALLVDPRPRGPEPGP